MSLPESEQDAILTIGLNIYQTGVNVLVESASWGIYALLFTFAVYIQCSNGLKSARSRIMLGVTCLLFLSSTTLLSLNATWFLRNKIRKILVLNPGDSLADKFEASQSELPMFGQPSEALFLLNMLVGDSVVVWRAWVIWERRITLILVPVVCLLAALGFAITDVICLHASSLPTASTIPVGARVCVWAEPISWGLSLLTNIISTSLIAVKAWLFRQTIKQLLGTARKSQAQRALILLVESGFIYCLFWIGEITLFFPIERTSNARYLWEFFAGIGDQISGMYPTAIMVLVSLQQTFVEATMVNTQKLSDAPLTRISFARSAAPVTSTIPRTLDTTSTQVGTRTQSSNQEHDSAGIAYPLTERHDQYTEGSSAMKEEV
ncbi:hypothetical protein K435DRAFT_765987 [Dendrothele bispora CBS 962.96]|uniref:Family A G protein-coupled receptor-like protein n=1 Tax=Dendrothele bispora (strain CBS 962.96) TaxID=1314807 RepID=A0A4S8L3U7_DENBC|nr:hypothetical protein K435DRAFT_765987 [Dendrothele bispora CBS 962.96]